MVVTIMIMVMMMTIMMSKVLYNIHKDTKKLFWEIGVVDCLWMQICLRIYCRLAFDTGTPSLISEPVFWFCFVLLLLLFFVVVCLWFFLVFVSYGS